MEDKSIKYYNSMGSDCHAYETGLIRYLKDEWAAKKGDNLLDTYKYKIVGAVDSVMHQQNVFDCGLFPCTFQDCFS